MFYKDDGILGSKVTCLAYTICVQMCVDRHTVIPVPLGLGVRSSSRTHIGAKNLSTFKFLI